MNTKFQTIAIALILAAGALTSHAATDDTAAATSSSSTPAFSLEGANSSLGRRYFIQCQACHTLGKGEVNQIGPNLWGIVGRTAGKSKGFNYSADLQKSEFKWTLQTLDEFLTKPAAVVPGTVMVFTGIPNQKMRRDLLAYLVQETASPAKR